jgi:hypothetical protein
MDRYARWIDAQHPSPFNCTTGGAGKWKWKWEIKPPIELTVLRGTWYGRPKAGAVLVSKSSIFPDIPGGSSEGNKNKPYILASPFLRKDAQERGCSDEPSLSQQWTLAFLFRLWCWCGDTLYAARRGILKEV